MKFLSLFSGIEAASAAWVPLGWSPVAFAEVEPFPCSVLRAHYPRVPNLGDVTKITREQIESLGPLDLVCGGFPCQDLSMAGRRKGLMNDDGTTTRSGLFFDLVRIAEWANARWLVAENVPGMFSSSAGRDFAAVVGTLAGCQFDVPADGWRNAGVVAGPRGLVEWATLDAQYVRVESHPRAVPQRRRRVFIVRDSGNWRDRPPLFLERESLCGHPAPRRQTGQGAAAGTLRSTDGGSCVDHARGNQLVAHSLRAEGFDASDDGTGRGTPLIPAIVGQAMSSKWAKGTAGPAGPAGPAGDEHHNMIPVPFDTTQWAVRRLTPLECERLMGFPDRHTDVLHKGKPAADVLRYRALGNSWAVNVATWVGTRIQQVDKCLLEHQTQQALEQGAGRHTTPTTYERAHAAPGS